MKDLCGFTVFSSRLFFGGVVMEFFWLAGPYHKHGTRKLTTVKLVYIDFYLAAKMNTGGRITSYNVCYTKLLRY